MSDIRQGRLENKIAVVSGGARGIGEAISTIFAREGATVIIGDLREEEGQATVAKIVAAGGKARFVTLDVANEGDWTALYDGVKADHGRLDILINNAGIGVSRDADGKRVTIETLSGGEWDRVMAINGRGVFFGTKHALPLMKLNRSGSIVNISSVAGIVGGPTTAYGASKGAVRAFTKVTAVEGAPNGIRCNSIHPGAIETPILAHQRANSAEYQKTVSLHLLGRLGAPEEIAYGALYLASDEAAFTTGAELVIDGGWTAQ